MKRGKERGREKEEASETGHDEGAETCSLRDGAKSEPDLPFKKEGFSSRFLQHKYVFTFELADRLGRFRLMCVTRAAGGGQRSKRCQPLLPLMHLLPVFMCASGGDALQREVLFKGAVPNIAATSALSDTLAKNDYGHTTDLPCTCTQGARTAKR